MTITAQVTPGAELPMPQSIFLVVTAILLVLAIIALVWWIIRHKD